MATKYETWQFDITFTGRGSWRVKYTTKKRRLLDCQTPYIFAGY